MGSERLNFSCLGCLEASAINKRTPLNLQNLLYCCLLGMMEDIGRLEQQQLHQGHQYGRIAMTSLVCLDDQAFLQLSSHGRMLIA